MHPVQSRMARTALKLGIRDVAKAAKVSTSTIFRLENGEELRERTVIDIQRVYEEAGARFVNADEWVGILVKAAEAG